MSLLVTSIRYLCQRGSTSLTFKNTLVNTLTRSFGSAPDNFVHPVETSLRDGIQNASVILGGKKRAVVLSIEERLTIYRKVAEAGYKTIEVGSMTKLPTMRDSAEFYQRVEAEGRCNILLVPTLTGMTKLIPFITNPQCLRIAIFAASTETFTRENIQCSINQSFERFAQVVAVARRLNISVRGYLSCLGGCPFEGRVPIEQSVEIALRLREMCDVVVPSDTTGVATAEDIDNFMRLYKKKAGPDSAKQIALHLHGEDFSRVDAGLAHGVKEYDVALGGIGGCPVVTKAKGNLPALDFLKYVHSRGYVTGIDEDKTLEAQNTLLKLMDQARERVQIAFAEQLPSHEKALALRSPTELLAKLAPSLA